MRGVGIDLEDVNRFDHILQNPSLLHRMFREEECAHIRASSHPAASAAGIYCAREALAKAIGSGLNRALFSEVELIHDARGRPEFQFSGDLAAHFCSTDFHVSISHTQSQATAIVIWD